MPVIEINGQKVEVGDEFLSLSPEDQQAWVNEVGASITPQESRTVAQSFTAGVGDSLLLGQGERISGLSNYVAQGGAPGSYDTGAQEYAQRAAQEQSSHPGWYMGGQGTGMVATGLAVPGGGRLAARGVEETLRYGGKAAEKVSPIAALLGDFWKYAGLKYGGRSAQKLADVLKRGRTGRSEPPPGTGALSAEMKAALKRGKFRHDYSTGEWADLLEPGGISKYRGDY